MSEWEIVENPQQQYSGSEWEIVEPNEMQSKGWQGALGDVTSGGAEYFRDIADLLSNRGRQNELAVSGAKELGGALSQLPHPGSLATQLPRPGQLSSKQGAQDYLSNVEVPGLRAGKNIAAGLGQAAQGLVNTPAHIADYLSRKGIISEENEGKFRRMDERNFPEILRIEGERPGDRLLRMVGELGPYFAGGEIGLGAKGLKGLARGVGQRSGAMAAHAIGQNENPVKAALGMAVPELGLRGVGKAGELAGKAYRAGPGGIAENLASSSVAKYSPDVPSEELMRGLRTTEGTQTPLGDIINSPFLKKGFENTVAPMLGSGADEIFTSIAQDLNKRGNAIIQRMSNNPAGSDPNYITKDLLTDANRTATQIKNNLWNNTSEIAQKEGFNLELPSFNEYLARNKKLIEDMPLIKHDEKVNSLYKKITSFQGNVERTPSREVFSTILDSSGNPVVSESIPEQIKYPSITESKTLANHLDSEANKIFNNYSASSLDKNRAKTYKEMADRLRADVQAQVSRKGSPELQSEYTKANDYYKNEFSDFLDKDIFPLTRRDKSGQSIVREIIKPGIKDQFEAIQKVNNLLPENQQEILGFSYLLDAFDKEGNINPSKVNRLVRNLGPRQFETLFRPETQKELLDYGNLVHMNKESINRLFNPHTGKRNQDAWKIATNAIAAVTGQSLGGLAGAFLLPSSLALGAKLLTRLATSEKFRQNVVGKKIRRRAETHREAFNE